LFAKEVLRLLRRPADKDVADEIDAYVASFAAMGRLIAPVVDDVVDQIQIIAAAISLRLSLVERLLSANRRVAGSIVGPKIAVESVTADVFRLIFRRQFAADKRTVAMRAFGMERIVQPLGDDRVLN